MHTQTYCTLRLLHLKLLLKYYYSLHYYVFDTEIHSAFTIHIFQGFAWQLLVFVCCDGLKGSSRSCVLMLFNYYEKKLLG